MRDETGFSLFLVSKPAHVSSHPSCVRAFERDLNAFQITIACACNHGVRRGEQAVLARGSK